MRKLCDIVDAWGIPFFCIIGIFILKLTQVRSFYVPLVCLVTAYMLFEKSDTKKVTEMIDHNLAHNEAIKLILAIGKSLFAGVFFSWVFLAVSGNF